MRYRIETSDSFDREVKRLSKRYLSMAHDIATLKAEILSNPSLGIDLGGGLRKIRMRIASKGKGKSGGARVITHTLIMADVDAAIIMVAIYDKSEKENLTDKELLDLARKCGLDSIG